MSIKFSRSNFWYADSGLHLKSAEVECRGPVNRCGVRQPLIRTYMDNLTITTTSVRGSRCTWVLGPPSQGPWCWRRGKNIIPSITEQPVTNFHRSLKNIVTIQKSTQELGTWLTKVHRLGLHGKLKIGSISTTLYRPESCSLCWSKSLGPRKEDQWLSSEEAGPSTQP